MKPLFFIFILAFLFIYGMINFYIGQWGWKLFSYIPLLQSWLYWVCFWVIAFSYPISRLGRIYLPDSINRFFTLLGSYWLAAMFYILLIAGIVKIIRFVDKWTGFIPAGLKENMAGIPVVGLVVLGLVAAILIYGTWNARNFQVVRYDVTINKSAGSLKDLHVIMASDLHLGTIVNRGRLAAMVESINRLQPDLVLLPGDVIDEEVKPFITQKMAEEFRRLKPQYGMFAVLGNHEYIGKQGDAAVRCLQEAGIHVLQDDYALVADHFYLVGRNDKEMKNFTGKERKSLASVMEGVDKAFPVILLDHEPSQLKEAEEQGVDLQLSGHTHRGQIFPNEFFTRKIYENDWGYLRKGAFQLIVSSGFGTWGPPIRVGSTPEIVDITIHFADSAARNS